MTFQMKGGASASAHDSTQRQSHLSSLEHGRLRCVRERERGRVEGQSPATPHQVKLLTEETNRRLMMDDDEVKTDPESDADRVDQLRRCETESGSGGKDGIAAPMA